LSNERTFATSSAFEAGVFDGLCMDAEGAVWAARWGSTRVVRYLPDGTLDMEVIMPKALNVTCCVFGGMFATLSSVKGSVADDPWLIGEDMQDLYITTASCGETDESLIPRYPQGGDLFRVRIDGVKGVERFKSAA
jgi:sugar lactone lactonase YvrE